jgi:hypothetical protein
MKRHKDDDVDVDQLEIEGHQDFTVSNRTRLVRLHTCDVELMEEGEPGPLKTRLRKSQWIIERRQRLDARVAEVDSDSDDF